MDIEQLFGRQPEQALVERLVSSAKEQGGSLLLRGEPGIGKSTILGYARTIASKLGYRILESNGVQAETHLAYAGLHQLLRPLLNYADTLPAPQKNAFAAVFGANESAPSDLFLIALASLNLLAESANSSPVVLLIDDVQWLDPATCDVLGFVARRLGSDSIVLIATLREGYESPFDQHTATFHLEPLDRRAAHALIQSLAPNIPLSQRDQILLEAAGNPLALVELCLSYPTGLGRVSGPFLTERLEQAFASRIVDLPESTRTLLLVAALDDTGRVEEILQAASSVQEAIVTEGAFEPALKARLVEIDDGEMRFRHPLVRSAIAQSASASRLQNVHRALADVVGGDAERRAWHRGAAAYAPDDEIASDLDAFAGRAQSRGAIATAITALERAAQLSTESHGKGARLLRAAELAFDGAKSDDAQRLLNLAAAEELGDSEQAKTQVLRARLEGGSRAEPAQIRQLIAVAEAQPPPLAVRALSTAASRLWAIDLEDSSRRDVADAVLRIPLDPDDIQGLTILAMSDKIRDGRQVLARLTKIVPDSNDPSRMYLAGSAASGLWAYDLSLPFLESAIDGLRAQGKLDFLARALGTIALSAMHLAREPLAIAAAEEAHQLADETQQPQWAVFAQLVQAVIEAERGNAERVTELTVDAEARIPQVGTAWMSALVNFARGRGAVAHHRYNEGLDYLKAISTPGSPAYHPTVGVWSLSDLVEAAVHEGQIDNARAYMDRLEFLATSVPSPFLQALLGYARPLLASDDEVEAHYQTAITKNLANWPCFRARMLLSYGRWLRRQRRIVESRVPLRAAREAFDALGFPGLSILARRELRATGEATVEPAPLEAWKLLTPQELQIAALAGQGLSNKEISEKLFLSPRTVASHLYHIFPKLQITSRSQLAKAMGS